jgi:hypothetical protein
VRRKRRFVDRHPVAQRAIEAETRARRGGRGFYVPSRADAEERVPAGYVLAERGRGEARLLGYAADPPGRGDGRRSRAAVARVLARLYVAHPDDDYIVAGHQRIAELALAEHGVRLSRQSAQRIVAELVAAKVLAVTSKGCSAAVTGGRNHVSVYAAIEPDPALSAELDDDAKALLGALQRRLAALDGHHPVGAVDLDQVEGTHRLEPEAKNRNRRRRERLRPARRQHPERYAPSTGPEALSATLWLLGWLGWAFTDEQARRLAVRLRPFFAAGWSGDAVAVALQRGPDGVRHTTPLQDDAGIRCHEAVLMSRLGYWRSGPDSRPVPPPVASAALPTGPQPRRDRLEQDPPAPAALPTRTSPGAAALAHLAALGLCAGRTRG